MDAKAHKAWCAEDLLLLLLLSAVTGFAIAGKKPEAVESTAAGMGQAVKSDVVIAATFDIAFCAEAGFLKFVICNTVVADVE